MPFLQMQNSRVTFSVPKSVATRKLLFPVYLYFGFMGLAMVPFLAWAAYTVGADSSWTVAVGGGAGILLGSLFLWLGCIFLARRIAYTVHVDEEAVVLHCVNGMRRLLWSEICEVTDMKWLFRRFLYVRLWDGDYIQLSPPLTDVDELKQLLLAKCTERIDFPGISDTLKRERRARLWRGHARTHVKRMAQVLVPTSLLVFAACAYLTHSLVPDLAGSTSGPLAETAAHAAASTPKVTTKHVYKSKAHKKSARHHH